MNCSSLESSREQKRVSLEHENEGEVVGRNAAPRQHLVIGTHGIVVELVLNVASDQGGPSVGIRAGNGGENAKGVVQAAGGADGGSLDELGGEEGVGEEEVGANEMGVDLGESGEGGRGVEEVDGGGMAEGLEGGESHSLETTRTFAPVDHSVPSK